MLTEILSWNIQVILDKSLHVLLIDTLLLLQSICKKFDIQVVRVYS